MKKVLLVCASGMSTSMLVKAIRKAADSQGYPLEVTSAGMTGIEDRLDEADALLVGPQIRHRFEGLRETAQKAGVPAKIVPTQIYGLMNGKAALDLIKEMIGRE